MIMSTTRTPPGFIWHYAPTDPPPRYRTDARRVECAADLPPRLFMGFRDDESFWKRGSLLKRRTNFGISYRNEGEVVGELRYEDGSLSFREQWKGIGGPP